jgi:hypothetical protein
MGATAKLSRRVHNLNKPSRPIKGKASFAVQRKFLKHFTKKDDKKSDS